ncbi:MAG: UDP-N-acetylglucosamine 2-epimerase (non-hydrolyzing) [Chitinophagaceae bacterium]|nr:UDP-N-acetylglucosamine 2-epimerase (non-hydrolyzing) [Chitinophagaceae bacterium]MCA6489906.1 UDP-N-acetylglucosamine 2-epimerase (non-hydrolyzing) [Chitinophagaceae bacterium]MCA6511701.1 UDP-N-acetylglucosamine 2-epimerase (non-hydrolyzing) [Chitinophagaceae bacterium]
MSRLKLATIVGTRPEIIRLSEIIKKADICFEHVLVHTGQNYDYTLNEIFFEELGIRKPDYHLQVTGANVGSTIGNIIAQSYDLLTQIQPDALLVLGDTNSVLCTIAAKRLKIPIFHLEAGNRCFDQNVPEEINRKISDHISDVNIAYTEHSRRYLLSEGFRKDHVFVVGSPLYEVIMQHQQRIQESRILEKLQLSAGKYILVSAHREENIDLPEQFNQLTTALDTVAATFKLPVIFSTHPRTQKKIEERKITFHPLIKNLPPFGMIDYIWLQKNAFIVLSDSGTISEESAIGNFPAISIRTSTERPEAIDAGSIILGDISSDEIVNAIHVVKNTWQSDQASVPLEYKVPDVSNKVIRIIQSYCSVINREIWRKI